MTTTGDVVSVAMSRLDGARAAAVLVSDGRLQSQIVDDNHASGADTWGDQMIPTITLCQAAIGMASLSLVLQLAAAIARSRSSIYMDAPAEPSLAPVVLTAVPDPTPRERPSLKLSRAQLLEIARTLGVRNARWRNAAKKTNLLLAIREHNQQRSAAA